MSAWWDGVVEAVDREHHDDPDVLPGAVLAAETRDGPQVAAVGPGWTADTICEIGTMSKAFVGAAVVDCLERDGRFDVDTELARIPGMDRTVDRRLAVRHLLQHTSGLPSVQPRDESAGPCRTPGARPVDDTSDVVGPTVPWTGYPGGTNELIEVDGRCRPARSCTVAEVAAHVMSHHAPTAPPGERFFYAPFNYVVAAWIVETLSGLSINRYLARHLFAPAGMVDSFFVCQPVGDPVIDGWMDDGVTPAQRSRIASVALITRDGRLPPEIAPGPRGRWDELRRGWRFCFPDGGMFSTAADLLTFLRLLRDDGCLDGRRILSARTVALLREDQGFGHTMGFGYRSQSTPAGHTPGTIEQLGSKMTYCWLAGGSERSSGVFLSQRLPNISVDNNMSVGMKVIFKTFLPAVAAGAGAG